MNFQTTKYLEELDDVDDVSARHHQRKGKRVHKQRKSSDAAPLGKVTMFDPVAQLGVETEFNPTFSASRFERAWILEYLGPFYEDHFIADVLRQVKGGKEATVYCCAAHPRLQIKYIAAKVYRPKIFRTLKNDAIYRQGRALRDEENQVVRGRREKLAMKKKTDFGQELLHHAWLANEYQHLRRLRAAGVEVAKPIAQSENAILMEYLGDATMPAPTLNTVRLARAEASALFERILRNIALMLAHDCVHADLSAFNILYWDGDIRIIDFPQAVSPHKNPDAFKMFERDVARVCQYFARYDLRAHAAQLARELWTRNAPRDSSQVFL